MRATLPTFHARTQLWVCKNSALYARFAQISRPAQALGCVLTCTATSRILHYMLFHLWSFHHWPMPFFAHPHFAFALAGTSTFGICHYWLTHLLHFHYLPFHNSHTASWRRGGASGRRDLDADRLVEYRNIVDSQSASPTFSVAPPTYVSPPRGLRLKRHSYSHFSAFVGEACFTQWSMAPAPPSI